jgi:charged multivesicular body protein 3
MDSFKAVFFKPDPREQKRKCDSLIRQNKREIDRSLGQLRTTEAKLKQTIKQDARKMQNNPALAKSLRSSIQALAKEIAGAKKHEQRLNTNKAQLDSVQMQVNESFAVRKIEGSLKSSAKVMREVNSLTKLPELSRTMQELSQELMKAGIIEEMVGDMLPDDELLEDDIGENEAEINNIIKSALTDKEAERFFGQKEEEAAFPSAPDSITQEEPDTELSEDNLAQMRQRLETLRS